MKTRSLLFALVVSTLPLHSSTLHAQWPQFRGPDGTGNASSANLPLTWAEDKNVRWKTAVHGRAWSSPVILGNQVWLTTAPQDGRQLFAVAVDRDSGKIIHNIRVFQVNGPQYIDPFNYLRLPDARHRARAGLCHIRLARNRGYQYPDRQGSLGASRSRVQPLSWRRFVTHSVRGPAADAFRWQRSAVRRGARQEHWKDRVADAAVDRFPGSRSGWKASSGRGFSEGVCDAAHRDGGRQASDGEQRIEGDLRIRPATPARSFGRSSNVAVTRPPRGRCPAMVSCSWRRGGMPRSCWRCGPTEKGMSRARTWCGESPEVCHKNRRCCWSAI